MGSGRTRRSWGLFLAGLMGLALLVGAVLPASAQEEVAWRSYDVTVAVREDGTVKVVEQIEVAFNGEFRQGHRSIPLERIEEISNITVQTGVEEGQLAPSTEVGRDEYSGEPGTHRVYTEDGRLHIDYGFERTGGAESRFIVISYDASGVIRVYPENDPPRQEIRWTAISSEVTDIGPIDRSSATITFPESIEGSEATRFDPEPTVSDAMSVRWERSRMGEGSSLQVLASFPAITDAAAPAWQAEADRLEPRREMIPGLSMVAGVATMIGFGLLMAFMWRSGLRDPDIGLVADILPDPPDDLPAGLVGTLVDETFDVKDAIGMLIDVERRGIVRITEDAMASGKPEDPKRFHITLEEPVSDAPAWAVPFLEGLFGEDAHVGKDVTFEQLKVLAQRHKGKISRACERELFERGYYEEMPNTTRKKWILRALLGLLPVGAVILAIALWTRTFSGWLIALGILAVVLFIATSIMAIWSPRKSVSGAEVAAKWKAFGRYLKEMEREMPPAERRELFDAYLPWAIALGFDKSSWERWMRDDDGYRWGSRQYRPWDPTWQHHRGGGNARHAGPASSSRGSGSSFDVQTMSDRGLGGVQAANLSMFALLNSATGTFQSGSSSSGSGSGSASVGSSGGGGHSFS